MRRYGWLALLVLLPASASAYEGQWSLDAAAGWGIAPTLQAPNTGPVFTISSMLGIGDTWAVRPYVGYAIDPAFNAGSALHIGLVGLEGLYVIDIATWVPSFGVGLDAMALFDGARWNGAFCAHLVISLDYLATREVAIGVDVRPYFLLNALDTNPFYLTFALRATVLFDY